jgi:hypothetical protein
MRHMAEVLSLLAVGVSLLSALGCSTERVVLVRDGQPAAEIVVSGKPTRAAQLAAAEIQEHVRRITGATLPIVSAGEAPRPAPPAGRARILVGQSRLTCDMGLRGSDFKPQEYLIHFAPGTVVLIGRDKADTGKGDAAKLDYAHGGGLPDVFDDQGTCYAAYDFLERYCGVRWLAPGELGLACPQTRTLEVGGPDVRRAPFLPHRHGPYIPMYGFIQQNWGNPSRADLELFWRRQRAGGQAYTANHSFYGYYERFWKKNVAAPDPPGGYHPEFFAQGYEAQPPQMCFTNEGFIQQVVRDARDFFDGKGKLAGAQAAGDFFALVPMDNSFWCKCPKCQALMNPPGPSADFANDEASDYFFQFANRVAREVRKTHPDKWLACLAYSSYTGHPRRVKLEPNISIQFCMTVRNWWAPATEKVDLGLFRDWVAKERGRPFYLWLYYCFPEEIAMNNKFHCFPGFFAHTIARQFRMFADDGVKGFFLNNLGEYLDTYATFRLADDPHQDIDALIDEFHRLYYGPAAEPMKKLYLGIEATYMNPKNYPPDVAAGRVGGHQSAEIAWKWLGTAERMAEWGRLMDQAKSLATAEPHRRRVTLFEETFWNYMVAGRKQFEQRAKAAIPAPRAPRVGDAGGDVARVAWDKAAALGEGPWFDRGTDKPSARKFAGRIAHDQRYLYLELTDFCDPKKLTAAAKVFPCDDWEVFVAGQRAMPYRQYAVGPTGQVVAMANGEVNWRMNVEIPDHGLRVASDTAAADRWTVRMAIPLKTAIAGGVASGGKVYLNVVRVSSPAVWGGDGFGLDTFVSFCSVHDVDRLAEVTLER